MNRASQKLFRRRVNMSGNRWIAVVLTALLAAPVLAQDQGGQNRGGDRGNNQGGDRGGDRGNRGQGNFDPAQFRQRFEERVKEQLGASDDEWKVIQPKLTKV